MMRIFYLCFLFLWSVTVPAQQADISGNYSGNFEFGNFVTDLSFDIEPLENSYRVKFNSLSQNAFGIPAREVELINDSLAFVLQSDFYRYEFTLLFQEGNELKGFLTIDNKVFDFRLAKNEKNELDLRSKDIRFRSAGLLLYGTVYYPNKPNGKAIYLLTSSGNQDRSAVRAEAMLFAKAGYVSMITDKRGTGISDGNWQTADIYELSEDDLQALEFLHQSERMDYANIGIKGSSQGATKVPYILKKNPRLGFGIVVSCPASTLLESDLNYWRNRNAELIGQTDLLAAQEMQRAVFQYIALEMTREELEVKIKENEAAAWFKHIWIPPFDEVVFDPKLMYSPMPYFSDNKSRLLVMEGTKDEIIPSNSLDLIEKSVGKKGHRKNSFELLKGANHAMMQVEESDFMYWQSLHPSYFPTILQWIDKL